MQLDCAGMSRSERTHNRIDSRRQLTGKVFSIDDDLMCGRSDHRELLQNRRRDVHVMLCMYPGCG